MSGMRANVGGVEVEVTMTVRCIGCGEPMPLAAEEGGIILISPQGPHHYAARCTPK